MDNSYTNQLITTFLFSVLFITSSELYGGAVFTWTGSSNTSWTNITNWSKDGDDNDDIPDADDVVIIPNIASSTYPILGSDMTIFRLSMDNSILNLNGHTLTITTKSYSDITNNSEIIFGTTGKIETKTGAPDNDTPYGTFLCTDANFTGNITMTGGLQFHTCTFGAGNHVLSHVGDSHYNGGNTINGNITLINDESVNNGHWYWGNTEPDVFNGNVIVQSLSRNRKEIRLADNSPNNVFNGTVDIRTYTGGSVKIAHGSNGSVTFHQPVTITNETVDPNGERVSYIGYDGTVVFKEDLNIKFTTIGASQAEISVAGNQGDVTFEKNVTIDNDKTDAGRIVRFGNTNEFVSVPFMMNGGKQVHLTGASSQIVLQDFNSGELYFQYVEKTSSVAQDFLNMAENKKLISKYSDWNGNFQADAGVIHLRENVFRGATIELSNYGILPIVEPQTSHRYSGGNTFVGATELSLGTPNAKDADYDWVFGHYEPDIFNGGLTARIYTTGPRTLYLSKNASGNEYTDVTLNTNDNGEIVLGDESSQTSEITGNLTMNLSGAKYQHFGSRGITKFHNNITATITSGSPYVEFAENGGSLDFVGTSTTATFIVTDFNATPTTHEVDFLTISGGGKLALASDWTVMDGLKLDSGYIDVGGKILNVGDATITGGDIDSYIIAEGTGHLEIKADNGVNRTFPMGGSSANEYMPLTINHSQGGTVDFKVKAPSGGATSGLTNYWNISHDKGIFDATLTPNWEAGAGGSSASDYFMVGKNPDFGALATSGANVKGITQSITGQANGFLGDFDVSMTKKAYAGADQTVSACAQINLAALGTGTWSFTDTDVTLVDPSDPMTAVNISSGASFPKTVNFTWTSGGQKDVVAITFTNEGGGGSLYQVWTNGTGNNNWFDCENWQGYTDEDLTTTGRSAVPDINTYVFITSDATTAINTDNDTISCKFLSISLGSKLNIGTGSITVTNELLFNSADIYSNKGSITAKGNMRMEGSFFNNFITINYEDDGTARSHSFNGDNTFETDVEIVQNSTETNLYFGADHLYMNGGGDTFKSNVRLCNNEDTELILSHSATGNTIGGDVTVNNKVDGWVRIGHPDNASKTETTLADGKSINLTGSTAGKFMVLRMLQAGGAPNHQLNTNGTMDIYIHSSQMRGDLMIYGNNVEVRESELGINTSSNIFITTNSAEVKYNGGNTFHGNTTLNHEGASSWHWGYTGGDKFMGNALIINDVSNNEAYTFIADKSVGNEFHGTTYITAQADGGVYIAENNTTQVTFKGKTHLWGNRTIIYDGSDGRGRDAINIANKGEAVFEDDLYASFSNTGAIDAFGMYMSFAYDSGKVTLDDVILDDQTNTTYRRGYYFGNQNSVKDDANAFQDQVVLNGGFSVADPNGFDDGLVGLAHLTQTNTDALNLDIKNAILTLYNSELKGALNVRAKASAYRWNVIDGESNLWVVNPDGGADYYNNASYGNFRSGGNYFTNKATIIYNTTNTNAHASWEWGAGTSGGSTIGADIFMAETTFENQCDNLLIIAAETEGNAVYDDLIVKNTANGEIEIAKSAIPTDKINLTVKGNITLDNQSTTTAKRINLAEDGIMKFGGDLTTQSAGGEIYLAYGGVATNGWLYSDGNIPFNTAGTEFATTALQTLNFATDKTFLHKLQNGSYRILLASDVDFVNTDTDAHLKFTTGRIDVSNYDLNLYQGQLTAPSGGTAKADFKVSNIVASANGYFERWMPNGVATLLPIATDSLYYPAIVTMSNADLVGGRVFTLLSDNYSNTNQPNGNLIRNHFTSVSWVLTKEDNTANSNVDLEIQWNGVYDELPNYDRTETDLNRYNSFVTSVWQCSGVGFTGATDNGDGTYSLSASYSGLNRLGVFAPTSPYVNAGADITVSSCQFGALNAHVYPGTAGVVEWVYDSSPSGDTDPTITHPDQVVTDITGVADGGQYAFEWTSKKPVAFNAGDTPTFCTVESDFTTITTNGTTSGTAFPGPDTYWTGASTADNTDWYDCTNWSAGIPGANTLVYISANAGTAIPKVPSDITIKSLSIYSDGVNDGAIDLDGHTINIEESVSFNTAVIKGSGELKVQAQAFITSDIFDITNTTFKGDVALEADRFAIGLTTFDGDADISKIGNDEDRWYGGNTFQSASFTLTSNGDWYLSEKQGSTYKGSFQAHVESTSANIYFTTAFVTAVFEGQNLYFGGSKKKSDWYFGDGTIEFYPKNNFDQRVYSTLSDEYKFRFYNVSTNNERDWKSSYIQQRDAVIDNHLKLGTGWFGITNNWNESYTMTILNSDPDALILARGGVGDPQPYKGRMAMGGYSKFGRNIDFSRENADYRYPENYRELVINTTGDGDGDSGIADDENDVDEEEIIYLDLWGDARENYREDHRSVYGTSYNQEFINDTWFLTHEKATAKPTARITMHWYEHPWNTGDDREMQYFNRKATVPVMYNYEDEKWECIGQAHDVSSNEFISARRDWNGASVYSHLQFVTSNVIADGDIESTNFGVFGVASASARTDWTDNFQTVRECLSVELNANASYESPIGGEWFFASASPNLETLGMTTVDVVFASATDSRTYASVKGITTNPADTYQMVFRWVRKCVSGCIGAKACGDGSDLDEDFVTVTIDIDNSLTQSTTSTWIGAADNDWDLCANWIDGNIPGSHTEKIEIPGAVNYARMPDPSDATFKRFITALEITNGGGLDLNGNKLEIKSLLMEDAFMTGFYTGGLIHEFDPAYITVSITSTDYDFITGNFITVTDALRLRRSTFYNNIGIFIDNLPTPEGNAYWDASLNGGNTFKENTIIHHEGENWVKFGWDNNNQGLGGPDIFEKNLYAYNGSCLGTTTGATRVYPPWRRLLSTESTSYQTSYPTSVDWIAPDASGKFYEPQSCTGDANDDGICDSYTKATGSQGFPDYARYDTRPTNTGNPDTDGSNASANESASADNQADLDLSMANIADAQANVEEAYKNLSQAEIEITNANLNALDMLTVAENMQMQFATAGKDLSGTPADEQAYRDAVKQVEDAVTEINNILAGGCSGKTIDQMLDFVSTKRQEALYGVDGKLSTHNNPDPMNSPGDDNTRANEANQAANDATACAYELFVDIETLYRRLQTAASAYNRLLYEPNNNALIFAENTEGTEFQDSTRFISDGCGTLRIARWGGGNPDGDATAYFTGKGKKHDFINRSERWGGIIVADDDESYVEFNGGGSWSNSYMEAQGVTFFAWRGHLNWATEDTVNVEGHVIGSTAFGGGPWTNSGGRVDLNGQFLVQDDRYTNGSLQISNFNQNSQKHDVDIHLDKYAAMWIEGNSNFASNVTIRNRGADYPQTNDGQTDWTNRSQVRIAEQYTGAEISFNGLLSLIHEPAKDKYSFTSASTPALPYWRTDGSDANFYLNRRSVVNYNGGVFMENEIEGRYGRRSIQFGDFGYPGYGVIPDGKSLKIGTEGYRSGNIEITNMKKYGEGKQFLILPPEIILPENTTYFNPEFGVDQKTSSFTAQVRIESSYFEGPVHVEAPQLAVRDNKFEKDVKLVSYGSDGGAVSGGNTFMSIATFELRSMEDEDWNWNKTAPQTHTTKGGKWILGNSIPDDFHDDIYLNNYGYNTLMGVATSSDDYFVSVYATGSNVNKFEGTVTIHNKPIYDDGGHVWMHWSNEWVGNGGGGQLDEVTIYTWTSREYIDSARFLIGGYENAVAEFEKEVIIINETEFYDVEIAGYEDNQVRFKQGLKITNKYPEGYTPNANCYDAGNDRFHYRGDVIFGFDDPDDEGKMTGGFTTVDEGITLEEFVDGTLELNGVAVTSTSSNDLLSFDMPGQMAGDAGKGRLHLGFCSINQKLEARSIWLRSNTSHYGADVNFERTHGDCNLGVDWRAKNIYEGDFKLVDESKNANSPIILASFGKEFVGDNLGDMYKGFATFEVESDAANTITVADKFISEFSDNITLQFNTITPLNNIKDLDTENPTPASTTDTDGWWAGIKVVGSGTQQLSSSHPVIVNRLRVEQQNGSATLDLDQEMTINVRVHFEQGKVVLGTHDVNIKNSKSAISTSVQNPNEGHFVANSSGTINRQLYPIIGSDFDEDGINDGFSVLFPIGNLTNYLPATLTLDPASGVEDMYRARLIDDVYTTYDGHWNTGSNGGNGSYVPSDDAKYAPNSSPTSIDRNFVRQSWVITEDVIGGTDGTLMLQWYEGDANVATDEPPGFDRSKTTIVHYQADKNTWRCIEEPKVAQESAPTSAGGKLIRIRTFDLLTDATTDEKNKMGVFSVGSLTAGNDAEVSTCGAGAAQLTAAPLSPPLEGEWDFVTVYHDETGLFIPPDVFSLSYEGPFTTIEEHQLSKTFDADKYADFTTGIAYNDATDPNGIVFNLEANKVYMFKWQPTGLDGDCSEDFATVLIRTGSFTSAIENETLIWQGNDQYFWDCTNWLVEGGGTNYALPNATMDLVVPMVTAVGTNTEPWYPEYYDKVLNLEVKSIRVEKDASFTVGGLDITSQENAQNSVELRVSEFVTVHEDAEFTNRYRMIVEDKIHNEGTFNNVPYFITGSVNDYTTPELVVYDAFENHGTDSKFEAGVKSNVTLYGDLMNEGEIFHTIGIVNFQSASSFITGGSDIYLRQMVLDKDNPTDFLSVANTKLFITANPLGDGSHYLQFDNGKINTYSNYLTSNPYSPSLVAFMSGAIKTNSNADRYVNGPVSKYFDNQDNEFVYPIGKNYWARARLSEVTVTTPTFVTAEYFASGFTSAPIHSTTARPLEHVSKLEYWMLDQQSGDVDNVKGRVTLYWENGARSNIGSNPTFDNTDSYKSTLLVAHLSKDFNNDGVEESATEKWINEGGLDGTGTSTVASGAVISHATNKIATFSPFTFVGDPDIHPLPVTWQYVQAKLISDGKESLVQWGTVSEISNDYFEVLRSKDGENYTVIGIVDATNLAHGGEYAFIDENPYMGVNYYQIRQVDYDGTAGLSRIVSVSREASVLQNQMRIYPNPTNSNNINLSIYSEMEGKVHIRMFDAIGQQIQTKVIHLEQGQNEVNILPNLYLAKGVYVISVDELLLKSKVVIE